MDSSLTFYLVLGALLVGFIVLGMLKGMIKMLLFGAAVLSAVAAYFWLSKYGFTYLLLHHQRPAGMDGHRAVRRGGCGSLLHLHARPVLVQ